MRFFGQFPTFNPAFTKITEDLAFQLTNDLWQARDEVAGITIDVGWYKDLDPAGSFRCRVIIERNWRHPAAEVITTDLNVVKSWVKGAIKFWVDFIAEDYA